MKASSKIMNPANSILSIIRIAATLAILIFLPGALPSHAAELKQATVEAWDGYVRCCGGCKRAKFWSRLTISSKFLTDSSITGWAPCSYATSRSTM